MDTAVPTPVISDGWTDRRADKNPLPAKGPLKVTRRSPDSQDSVTPDGWMNDLGRNSPGPGPAGPSRYDRRVRHLRDVDLEQSQGEVRDSGLHWCRGDLAWGVTVAGLVLAAFFVPHLHFRSVAPVINQTPGLYKVLAQTAPLLGEWLPHVGWGTPSAVIIALAVIRWGPQFGRSLSWRPLVIGTWLTAAAWAMSLALIDGWGRGFVGRMEGSGGYRAMVPRVGTISGLFHGFVTHIPLGSPTSWDPAVAGDPIGAFLTFVGLDRIGLGGPVWASTLCVVVGSSTAAAVLITVRALGGETTARQAAPFVALGPVAIWIAVSADAYFAGVAAWGLTMLALAATGSIRFSTGASVAAGLLLGCSVYLDYGLILMAVPSVAVLVIARNYRPLLGAVIGALAVAATFTAAGFWWFNGLSVLRHRYFLGIAMNRPFAYWSWANLAALTCAIGLPAAIALRRAFRPSAIRMRSGFHVLIVAFAVAVLAADISAAE